MRPSRLNVTGKSWRSVQRPGSGTMPGGVRQTGPIGSYTCSTTTHTIDSTAASVREGFLSSVRCNSGMGFASRRGKRCGISGSVHPGCDAGALRDPPNPVNPSDFPRVYHHDRDHVRWDACNQSIVLNQGCAIGQACALIDDRARNGLLCHESRGYYTEESAWTSCFHRQATSSPTPLPVRQREPADPTVWPRSREPAPTDQTCCLFPRELPGCHRP
jgi:hypothetical protein